MKSKLVIALLSVLVVVVGFVGYIFSTGKLTSDYVFEKKVQQTETLSDSNEIDDIESDLNDTDFDNLESDLDFIEEEVDSALND